MTEEMSFVMKLQRTLKAGRQTKKAASQETDDNRKAIRSIRVGQSKYNDHVMKKKNNPNLKTLC